MSTHHETSQSKSIGGGSSWSQEQTPFQQTCIQEREQVKVEIHRGARVAGTSHKVSGAPKNGVSRVYTMTVAPYSRLKKAKDLLRETAKPLTDFDYDLHIYQANCAAAAEDDGDEEGKDAWAEKAGLPMPGPNDERFWYRAERAKRFQVNKHFAALVSPRIVPTYRMRLAASGEDPSSGRSGGAAGAAGQNSLMKLTAAAALRAAENKQAAQKKSSVSHMSVSDGSFTAAPLPFVPSGKSEASEAICNRKPALFDTPFGAPLEVERREYIATKSQFLGPASVLATGGLARVNASCENGRAEKDELVRRMREKGEASQRHLQQEYFAKLRNFQQEWKNLAPMPVLRQIARDEVFNMKGCKRFIS